MDLVSLMYKYINRFINSDELLESLEELDLNNFTDEEKVSIKKLIDDIKSIKDKIPNEVDEIEKNRIEINEKYVNGIDKILQNNTLENKLARMIITGDVNYGSHVVIDGKDNEIIIKSE